MKMVQHAIALGISLLVVMPASAQTAPGPENLEVVMVPTGDNLLRWQAQPGRTYFIEVADPNAPLESWCWAPNIESGHGQEISYEVGGTADKAFFRLQFTDEQLPSGVTLADWDIEPDGLSNWDEITVWGTNPVLADTSGDGIPDGWAVAHGLPPLANNADGLFQGTSTTNLQAFQAGVQAHPNATLSDFDGDGIPNETDSTPTKGDEFIAIITTEQLYVLRHQGGETRMVSTWTESMSIDRVHLRYPDVGVVTPVAYLFNNSSGGTLAKATIRVDATSSTGEPRTVSFLDILDTDYESLFNAQPSLTLRDTYDFTIPAGFVQSQSVQIDPGFTDITASTPEVSYGVYFPRLEVAVLKNLEAEAPDDGLIVRTTDTVRYRISPDLADSPLLLQNDLEWSWRILKWDGTYSAWTNYQNGQGHSFTAQPIDAGIYEVKASVPGNSYYLQRKHDDLHSDKKKGENDCFGVVEEVWQINVRESAKSNLGSTAYARNIANGNVPADKYKCNLFVGDKASDAGATVPKINGSNPLKTYYPTANQWEGIDSVLIPGWPLLSPYIDPQPGFIVARRGPVDPATFERWSGHVGIVDYDGAWISAAETVVNRRADVRSYQPLRLRMYTP